MTPQEQRASAQNQTDAAETSGAAAQPAVSAVSLELLDALSGIHAGASLALVQKTRRSVREAAVEMREQRTRQRRTVGLVLMAVLLVPILLAPAVWESIDGLIAGEHVLDLSTQLMFLLVVLFTAMLAALTAVWKGQRGINHDQQL